MKASIFIATSLDGFIAREDGGIDWLPTGDDGSGEDYGYQEFMDSVDALVMGRHTYETVQSFGQWPYGKKPVFVLSSKNLHIPEDIRKTVSTVSVSPRELVTLLEKKGLKHLYIDGGKTIQSFLSENLIDQLIITKVPILIGNGIPLFGPLSSDVKLKHMETKSFPNGLVQSRYEVSGTK